MIDAATAPHPANLSHVPIKMEVMDTNEDVGEYLVYQQMKSFESCGSVVLLNNSKLMLNCNICSLNYTTLELFAKHLKENHSYFGVQLQTLPQQKNVKREICPESASSGVSTNESESEGTASPPPPMVAIPNLAANTCNVDEENKENICSQIKTRRSRRQASIKEFQGFIKESNSNSDTGIGSGADSESPSASRSPTPTSADVKPIVPLNCSFCDKTFTKRSRLIDHERVHTGEKPFSCDICGKSFRLNMRLKEHKTRHSGEKKFPCDQCDIWVSCKQDLVLHKRHHTGDKRYACEICNKPFVRSTDLKIHLRVHTNEKPFKCEECGLCFRANQNLIQHRNKHKLMEKPLKCDFCDKRFYRNGDRKVHHRTHTGEKPFKCEICHKTYSAKVHMRSHLERVHGVNASRRASTGGAVPLTRRRTRGSSTECNVSVDTSKPIKSDIESESEAAIKSE